MRMGDEVREFALKTYFHLCKERGARSFMEWRIKQAEIMKDPVMRKALRLRQMNNIENYN